MARWYVHSYLPKSRCLNYVKILSYTKFTPFFIIKEHRIFLIEYFMTVFGKFIDGFTVFFYAKI